MKNTKALKIFTIILSVALLVIGAVATTVSAEEATETPKVEIVSKNLSYTSNISIMFAVKAENVTEDVKLNVYAEDPVKNPAAPVSYTASVSYTENINAYGDCLVFFTEGIPAKAIEQEIYVQAVAGDVKSNVERYSIVEYCHEMNAKKDTDLYTNIITYGATIQQMLKDDGKFEGEYATAYKYVTIENGTLDGTYDSGIYLKNETVTPYAEGAEYWSDGSKVVANGATYTVGDSNVAFTAASAKELYTENFDDGTLPSNITVSNTLPKVSGLSNSYSVGRNEVSVFTENTTNTSNCLHTYSQYNSTQTVIKIGETIEAEENATVVEFEADICILWSTSSTNIEFFNLVLGDADGNAAFNIVLRNSTTANLAINHRNSAGTQKNQIGQTLLQNASNVWFKLRVTYEYVSETEVLVTAYLNGNKLSGTATSPYDESNAMSVSEITNAYIAINGKSSHAINVYVAIDNVVFRKIAE